MAARGGLDQKGLRAAIERSIPRGWAIEKGETVVQQLEAFLLGEVDRLDLTLSLSERKPALVEALTEMMIAAVTTRLEALPRCGVFEIPRATKALSAGKWPSCAPGGAGLLIAMAADEIREGAESAVQTLPDQVVVGEEELEQQLGEDAMGRLHRLRERVQTGIRFDQADLGWREGAPPSAQPPFITLVRGRTVGWALPSKHAELKWLRNVVSNEMLWWALAFATLATFIWTRAGTLRRRLQGGAAFLSIVGAITALATFGLGYVDWVGGAVAEFPPWVSSIFTPAMIDALNAEARTMWHRVASAWVMVAGVNIVLVWILKKKVIEHAR